MIISDYSVGLSSSHELTSYTKKEESLVQWIGGEDARAKAYEEPVSVNLSPAAVSSLGNSTPGSSPMDEIAGKLKTLSDALVTNKTSSADSLLDIDKNGKDVDENYLKLKILEALLYQATGRHIKIQPIDSSPLDDEDPDEQSGSDAILSILAKAASAQAGNAQGWGLDYSCNETKYESEKTSFSAKAVVNTADGRQINLDAQLSLSRELMQQTSLSVKAGDALIDPLVINFGGTAADLSDRKFSFDLDADGSAEQISTLSPGSGFLAMDKNGDGSINNGSELFGPSSGSGFGELSALDSDKSGWIDEKDSAYQKLKVWTVGSDGSKSLLSLKDSGVGAIYLGNAETEFALNGGDGATQNGQLKNTSIYLNENGSAGFIHEVDLVV